MIDQLLPRIAAALLVAICIGTLVAVGWRALRLCIRRIRPDFGEITVISFVLLLLAAGAGRAAITGDLNGFEFILLGGAVAAILSEVVRWFGRSSEGVER
jgi:hypothetical protein